MHIELARLHLALHPLSPKTPQNRAAVVAKRWRFVALHGKCVRHVDGKTLRELFFRLLPRRLSSYRAGAGGDGQLVTFLVEHKPASLTFVTLFAKPPQKFLAVAAKHRPRDIEIEQQRTRKKKIIRRKKTEQMGADRCSRKPRPGNDSAAWQCSPFRTIATNEIYTLLQYV